MKRLVICLLPLLICACASQPQVGTRDEALEAQARRYDAMATALDTKTPGSPNPSSVAMRAKAADTRAEKRVQPSFSEAVSQSLFDAVVDALLFRK